MQKVIPPASFHYYSYNVFKPIYTSFYYFNNLFIAELIGYISIQRIFLKLHNINTLQLLNISTPSLPTARGDNNLPRDGFLISGTVQRVDIQ
jgi:hypothetical protein